MSPPPQHTCLGLLIVEARREASAMDTWRRVATCYGRTAAAVATPPPPGGAAALSSRSASNASAADALDLRQHHLTRQDARADDMHVMSACFGRSVYEVTPVYAEEEHEQEAQQADAPAPATDYADASSARPRPPPAPRRTFAPPPACAGIELLQVLRASAAAAAAAKAPGAAPAATPAPARHPWPAAAAAASAAAAAPSSSSRPSIPPFPGDELAAFGKHFSARAEKNAAAMYKLLSDIGAGLVRGREE